MADNEFKGEKILLSSEKLIFNTTVNDIELNAKGMIHLTSGDSVRLDIGPLGSTNNNNLFVINAPRVQFGIATKGRQVEPVVKGIALAETLVEMMTYISNFADAVSASNPDSKPVLDIFVNDLKNKFKLIKLKLESPGIVKSDITYTT